MNKNLEKKNTAENLKKKKKFVTKMALRNNTCQLSSYRNIFYDSMLKFNKQKKIGFELYLSYTRLIDIL